MYTVVKIRLLIEHDTELGAHRSVKAGCRADVESLTALTRS
jgi:hypothetical protein